jgi:hypothetical protein
MTTGVRAMRIHITGASGSGTTTLAAALALALRGRHLDADDYYWLRTEPPFQLKREPGERLSLLLSDLQADGPVVLAGSIVGWGAALEDSFDLIVFLYLEASIRAQRLREREMRVLGHTDPAFLAWAAQYDEGPPVGRSLAKHRAWLADRCCPVVELHGDLTTPDRLAAVLRAVREPSLGPGRNGR